MKCASAVRTSALLKFQNQDIDVFDGQPSIASHFFIGPVLATPNFEKFSSTSTQVDGIELTGMELDGHGIQAAYFGSSSTCPFTVSGGSTCVPCVSLLESP